MPMVEYEKIILSRLCDGFRESRKGNGQTKIRRRTRLNPEKVYPEYRDNDGDFEKIKALNEAVEKLEAFGFVKAEREDFGTDIHTIYLVDEKVDDAEAYLSEKYGFISKKEKREEVYQIIEEFKNASPACRKKCEGLLKALEKNHIPDNPRELRDILSAVSFIENNSEEIYVRELSMLLFGDSKYFEDNIEKQTCRLIRSYRDDSLKEGVLFDEILKEYNVFTEPGKFSFKGDMTLLINGKVFDVAGVTGGVEIRESVISDIQDIRINARHFISIENRASYLRLDIPDCVIFYLGGFSDRFQRDFIRKAGECNPSCSFLHFGDIDAGGFLIHRDLCRKTGMDIGLFHMSEAELSDERYESCLHKLTDNDRKRLEPLLDEAEYAEIVRYMLANDVKLEQEIISLDIMKRRS